MGGREVDVFNQTKKGENVKKMGKKNGKRKF